MRYYFKPISFKLRVDWIKIINRFMDETTRRASCETADRSKTEKVQENLQKSSNVGMLPLIY